MAQASFLLRGAFARPEEARAVLGVWCGSPVETSVVIECFAPLDGVYKAFESFVVDWEEIREGCFFLPVNMQLFGGTEGYISINVRDQELAIIDSLLCSDSYAL